MKLRALLPALLACLAGTAHAAVKLPAVISDHAVLQRDTTVPVWGWADKGEEVNVTIAGQTQRTTAGADGKWRVNLDHLAAGGPHVLTVKGAGNTLTVNDVLVGEVWLGSGQSNMAFRVNSAINYEQEQAAADLPQIRHFTVPGHASDTALDDVAGKWEVCSPATVGGFSATLFFTGREIYHAVKVPVGLINSSVGGTPIESWIDAGAQHATPELKGFFEIKAPVVDPEKQAAIYKKQLETWTEEAKKARAAKQPVPRKPADPAAARARKGNVGGLYNGMIAGLIPYAIHGALWYQGEANSTADKAPFYQYQLPLLVKDWRKRWGYDFPFAWVQLPNFGNRGNGWCQVREAELKTLSLPHTGMAVTLDIGEPANIHPKNKQEVGRRLGLWARGDVYGEKIATSGPLYAGHEIKGPDVSVSFTHTDGGLVFKGEPLGFVVAGEDKQWHEAKARIDGDHLILSSTEVAKPVAARYAWADLPLSTALRNGAGLLGSPFRTDDWPLDHLPVKQRKPSTAEAPARKASLVMRVACVGDSITAGAGARNLKTGTYPAQLQVLLGRNYVVRNFGVGGCTMERQGDKPYDKELAFRNALAFKPDIVLLKLGTNDSKPQNWAHKDDFVPSAKALLSALRIASPGVKIWLCLPMPAFPGNFGITDKIIHDEVIPELRKLAEEEKLPLIDLYAPMKDQGGNVPDKVHPNDAGYRRIAAIISKTLTGKEPELDLLPSLEPGLR